MAESPIRVLVWDENSPNVPKSVYPKGIRGAIAEGLLETAGGEVAVRTAHLDEPEQGLSAESLLATDVLLWWGHQRHEEVTDASARWVIDRVFNQGLGLIALHSAHYSKPFCGLLKCPGHLKGGWREDEKPEHVRVCAPEHPIAHGVRDFVLAHEEMYGAPFDVPPADAVIFQSYFPAGGEYFPSGLTWSVGPGIDPAFKSGPGKGIGHGKGVGRVFYFRPGHESVLTFFNEDVRRVMHNAVRWAAWRT